MTGAKYVPPHLRNSKATDGDKPSLVDDSDQKRSGGGNDRVDRRDFSSGGDDRGGKDRFGGDDRGGKDRDGRGDRGGKDRFDDRRGKGGGYQSRDRDDGDDRGKGDRKGGGKGGGYKNSDRDRDDRDRDDDRRGGAGGGGGSSRFDCLKEEGEDDRQGKGDRDRKGGGKGNWSRSGDFKGESQDVRDDKKYDDDRPKGASRGGQGYSQDWFRRPDGRRQGEEAPTEIEIFGEKKERSTAGIDFENYNKIPVQVTGRETVRDPIERFSEAKLTEAVFENLQRCGYDRPTPVQKYAIPYVINGRDVMACAQTGSGKTCAFMVPCLESLLRSGYPQGSGGRRIPQPCSLVLAPTRELASQIHLESLKFAFLTGIRCCIVYGGADMREQRRELGMGVDVLVATPGRLTDMYERQNVSLNLISFFILDEADRMLDMGFEPQVRQIVEKTDMSKGIRGVRQSMMFSATFPREVQYMARDFLNDYVFITIGRVGSASGLITQKVHYAEDGPQKVRALERTLKEHMSGKDDLVVIFVETKRGADGLERDLWQAGVAVTAIHGDRSQADREDALAAFRSGQNPILVATDVAARGLDIPNVTVVINFDMPKQLDDYVHRIGRTGRAGRKGTAISFVNERCTILQELRQLLSEAKQDLPVWFEDLCKQRRWGGGGKGGGRGNDRFGGRDLRMEEEKKEAGSSNRKVETVRAARAPEKPQAERVSDFGVSGQEDAW